MTEVLKVENFSCYLGDVQISRDINFSLARGEILAVVGESGSGKSVTFSRMFGVGHTHKTEGNVYLCGEELLGMGAKKQRQYRGQKLGFLFQDPSTAFNPCMRLGDQLIEASVYFGLQTKAQALHKALGLLRACEINKPEKCLKQYPHELSGGMLQRVMLAMALMHEPDVLIADEPTTALDAISTLNILSLIKKLCEARNMACILITHDFDVVANVASSIAVMYAGAIVELGATASLLTKPQHPYNRALQACRPTVANTQKGQVLTVIDGQPPNLAQRPAGCAFHPRCSQSMQICAQQNPPLIEHVQCWLAVEEANHVSV